MLEMAGLGAKVLHSRCVELAKKFQVPLSVRSSFHEGEGTIVTKENKIMEEVVISGVTSDKDQAKVSLIGLPDTPGVAAEIFQALADASINIDMIIQNASQDGTANLSFTTAEKDLDKTIEIVSGIKERTGFNSVNKDCNIAKVSVIGIGMKSHVGIASKAFRALADAEINIQMISTSEIKISCVIQEDQTENAVQIIHDAFELGQIDSNA